MKRFFSCLSVLLTLALLVGLIPAAAAGSIVPSPAITAKAAYVMDYDTGNILYAKNDTAQLAPASTTKLLTAYLVFEAMEAGAFTEDTLVPVSKTAFEISSDYFLTNVMMAEDGTYTVRSLLEAMLVVSACGVCVSLAELVSGSEAAFVNAMNAKLAELGIEGHFEDSYGLSDDNRISARGLAQLSQLLIRRFPQVLDYTKKTTIRFDGVWYDCTNCLLPGCSAEYPGADGLKTGSTTAAGKCLVGTAKQNGRRVIAVLLGAATNPVRAQEIVRLLDCGFANLKAGSFAAPAPELQPYEYTPVEIPDETPDEPADETPDEQTDESPSETPDETAGDAAKRLYALGLLRGKGTLADGSPDLATADSLTRAESVVLLLRLLGLEQEALDGSTDIPFSDVPEWAAPYIACAWRAELVAGVSADRFQPDAPCDVRSYLTLLYRALGWREGSDFRWAEAPDFAAAAGFTDVDGLQATDTLTRGIAARLTWDALDSLLADGSMPLCQRLAEQGVLDGEAAAQYDLPVFSGIAADAA